MGAIETHEERADGIGCIKRHVVIYSGDSARPHDRCTRIEYTFILMCF